MSNYMIIQDMFSGQFKIYSADGVHYLGYGDTIEEAKEIAEKEYAYNFRLKV